ncbi:hypothetical protein ACFFTN_03615 [Aminobacter aganoensis]|uniref:Uncharacterized protein n=1 Tax=Aminobacter aganoensis TaxID=83264 RepID=A0A7X0F6K0_9HYPH|nr:MULTISPECIES: hypothetical protein [Aminobacter]KQU64358.1 hypothetical protein ASC75_14595 [Aminobacter sp. DSM 101952]MBB6354078.1 hypothetical protein [Aminobacter aganoensis]
MMHVAPSAGFSEAGSRETDIGRYLSLFGRVEALKSQVDSARRIANESLGRLNALPQPEIGENTLFVDALDMHRRDKEALFEAMRQLDAAREALRLVAAAVVPGR